MPLGLPLELERGETVLQRHRPEVEQLGVRAGSFLILPRIEAGATYDTNVFLTDTDTRHDWLFIVRPSVDVKSNFSSHALNFSASGDFGRYSEFDSENYDDYRVAVDGRYDIGRETALSGNLFHSRFHEGRSDPDAFASGVINPFQVGNFAEPVVYYGTGGEVALTQGFNRIHVRLSAQATNYDYNDIALVGGGKDSLEDRNRWEYGTALRVGYDLGTGYQPFVQAAYTRTDYERATDFSGRDRDANGYEFDVGAAFALNGLMTGEIFAGYLTRQYEDHQVKDFSGLSIGGQLNWTVTQLTTISGRLARQIHETDVTLGDQLASNYTRTIVALGVDHELRRNLLLNARLQWRQDDFNGIPRTDNVYTATAGATYLINRNLFLNGGYTYETRKSNVSGLDYKDNLLFLRLGVQM